MIDIKFAIIKAIFEIIDVFSFVDYISFNTYKNRIEVMADLDFKQDCVKSFLK